MRKRLAALALAALAVACSDQPTNVSEDAAAPTVLAMQTVNPNDSVPPGNGWTLLLRSTPEEADPATSPWVFEMPCLGAGNSVQYLAYWWWSKDFVVTPSGNMHATQRLIWNNAGYVAPNGDVWVMQKMNQPLIANWQRQGSEWVAENPSQAWYVNTRTGQRMLESATFVLRFPQMPPPVPNYTGWVTRHYGCQLMGPE